MKQYIILCSILVLLASCSNEPPSNPQATIEAIVDSTMAAIPTNTPLPTLTPEPTVTILPESTSTSGWITYINQAYGFSFMHPDLDENCCTISGPLTGEFEEVAVLADNRTTRAGTDKPFDGFSIFVVSNHEGLSLRDYVENEKAAQIEARNFVLGESNQTGTENAVTVDGQEGISIQGYSWDTVTRLYVEFPNQQYFLVLGWLEESQGTFSEIFNEILGSFQFSE